MVVPTEMGSVHGVAVASCASGHAKGSGPSAKRPSGEGYYDAGLVQARLEEAGRTLLALPQSGYTTGMRTNAATLIRHMIEAEGGEPVPSRVRPPVPSAAGITRMDEALAWIPLIPRDHIVLRRIVGARALVNPLTDRHLYTWRRLGAMLGADHKAVQRWHAQGVDMIVSALNAPDRARAQKVGAAGAGAGLRRSLAWASG